jgi:hypothetical protein
MESRMVTDCAIFGLDGVIWAKSAGFHPTQSEIQMVQVRRSDFAFVARGVGRPNFN